MRKKVNAFERGYVLHSDNEILDLLVTEYTVWWSSSRTGVKPVATPPFLALRKPSFTPLLRATFHSLTAPILLHPLTCYCKHQKSNGQWRVLGFFFFHSRTARLILLRKCNAPVLCKLTPTFFTFQVSARGPLAKEEEQRVYCFLGSSSPCVFMILGSSGDPSLCQPPCTRCHHGQPPQSPFCHADRDAGSGPSR